MTMNKLIHIGFVLFYMHLAYGQSVSETNKDIFGYMDFPKENIFIHHNTTLLFSGEYLYYKVYCVNPETKKQSYLSKVAYVELISEDAKSVFTHKISLKQGLGQGDFFVPVTLPSGNYKLVAYTQWMKNEGVSVFFQNDISIINPYQGNQKAIYTKETNPFVIDSSNTSSYSDSDENVKLNIENKKYTKRQKVSLIIKGLRKSESHGSYSLSVRKMDTIKTVLRQTAKNFFETYEKKKNDLSDTLEGQQKESLKQQEFSIPELRGELFSGKVISKNPIFKVDNIKVGISIPDEKQYAFKIATTNKKGIFHFNLNKEYNGDKAMIQVIGNKEYYDVELSKQNKIDYSNLVFNKFNITSEMKDLILDRSIYNQINNGYFSIKPDTLTPSKAKQSFYGNQIEVYNLDDFTRFSTVKETMVEILDNVWIDKNKNGEEVFRIRRKRLSYDRTDFLPLVIIDGLMIQNHVDLIVYNAKKIKTIKVSRDKYFYGSQLFGGIIDVETIEGDYYKSHANTGMVYKLHRPLPEKRYYSQKYPKTNKTTTDRVPDFRQQLLWIPQVEFDKDELIIDFFTSDNIGDYEICLEGFTKEGKPVSARKKIRVE